MLLANTQKKLLAEVMKYFVGLKSQISELSKINVDTYTAVKQKDLLVEAKKLREFLIVLQTCFEQFLIYLQACPTQAQNEGDDCSYSLSSDDSQIANCKKDDVIWNKANSYVKEFLSTVSNISKKFDEMFSEYFFIYEQNHESIQQAALLTSNHLEFITESFCSLRTMKKKMLEFSQMLTTSEDKYHPLLENIVFLQTNIDNKLSEFEQTNFSSELQEESRDLLQSENINRFENDLDKLLHMILFVIQEKYKKNCGPDTIDNEDEKYDEIEKNKLREKLVEGVTTDVKELKLKEAYQILNDLIKTIFDAKDTDAVHYCRYILNKIN